MTAIIKISDAMKKCGIRSIGFMPADNLIPRDRYSAQLLDSNWPSHIGIGDTVAEAYEKAVAMVREKEAA